MNQLVSRSQGAQDLFAAYIFQNARSGTYLDVGCQLPEANNNTCLLESELGWRGVSIDIENWSAEWAKERPGSAFICADALKCDYRAIMDANGLQSPISYLTLDVEGAGCRHQALERIVATGATFCVGTLEHDAYRGYAEAERKPQRKLMESLGYALVCADVCATDGSQYEDWWIHPQYVAPERYAHLVSEGLKWTDILSRMR